MFLIFVCIFLPLIIGGILFLFFTRMPAKNTGVLLFHRIETNFPRSLSSLSVSQFQKFCTILQKTSIPVVTFSEYSPIQQQCCLTFDDGDESIFEHAYPILKACHFRATVFVCSGLFTNDHIFDAYKTPRILNGSKLKELIHAGWEIGSHTVSHRDLTLLDDDDIFRELELSKITLERILQIPIKSLSFPYGSWNERVLHIARQCGYTKFSAYRRHEKTEKFKDIIPATAIYPLDSSDVMEKKIQGKIRGLVSACSYIIPQFAKGSPVFRYSDSYIPQKFFSSFSLPKNQKKKNT